MASITVIGSAAQPQKSFRLIDWLETKLQDGRYTNFIFEAAFAKLNPFLKLNDAFGLWKRAGGEAAAYIGIDHKGTSYQALRYALLHFDETYVTYARNATFHPKTYLFYGPQLAALYSGSNNFTPGGLETNFESGLILELDLSVADDQAIVSALLQNYASLSSSDIGCCVRLDAQILDALHKDGCLMDESPQGRSRGRTERQDIRGQIFAPYRAKPPRALPVPKKEASPSNAGTRAADHGAAFAAKGLVIQIRQMQANHNGEIMLSKTAVDQNKHFFGFPFNGRTSSKFAKNPSYPQRVPDPIVSIQVFDKDGNELAGRRQASYALNMVYYELKSEIRITISKAIMPEIPPLTILAMTKAADGGRDYDLVFYHPGSDQYDEYLAVCNQVLPTGGSAQPRRFGWI